MPRLDTRTAARFAVTLGVSAAGGFAAELIGLPAGWIAGGLVAVAVVSLAGFNTGVPQPLHPPVYLVLGIYSGAGVSPETLHQMQTWPASFAILAVSLAGLIAISYWWLHVRCGWDRNAAILASLPGALSFVMAAAEDLKTDVKKVAIAQSLRLLILVELIPLIALVVGHPERLAAAGAAAVAGPRDILILLAVSIAVSLVLERLRFPGGWVLGGLLASAGLLLGGVVEGGLPPYIFLPCMVAMSAIAGSRFRPGDMAVLPRIAKPALAAFAMATAISAAGAILVTLLFGVSFIQTLLAFAPGGLDALVVLAFQMNIDPAYVAAHHVARFLAIAAAVPLLARWLARLP